MTFTPDEIEWRLAICKKATPGPWHTHNQHIHCLYYQAGRTKHHAVADALDVGAESSREHIADFIAHFIAHAREGYPEALREIQRLQADLRENAAMLAKQCDMAREAECQAMEARAEVARLQQVLTHVWVHANTNYAWGQMDDAMRTMFDAAITQGTADEAAEAARAQR